jgi:hypothetical protein
MSNRQFWVWLGSLLSPPHTQKNGIHQGSVLSVSLFPIAISGIMSRLHHPVMCSLYVDNFTICYRFQSLPAIEWQCQPTIIWLSLWCQGNCFKFLVTKTICIYFCRLHGVFPHPNHFMDNSPLPLADTVRFLGLILDSHLIWEPHTWLLQTKCQRSLNILLMLTEVSWGASTMTMFGLHRCLICSWLDYGSSTSQRILSIPNPIHNSAVHLCTGGPLQWPKWKVSMQNQGNLYLPFVDKSHCVIMPQSWALSRETPPMEQYTSPLFKEGLCSIQRHAIQRALDSRSFWMHSSPPPPTSSLSESPLYHIGP